MNMSTIWRVSLVWIVPLRKFWFSASEGGPRSVHFNKHLEENPHTPYPGACVLGTDHPLGLRVLGKTEYSSPSLLEHTRTSTHTHISTHTQVQTHTQSFPVLIM